MTLSARVRFFETDLNLQPGAEKKFCDNRNNKTEETAFFDAIKRLAASGGTDNPLGFMNETNDILNNNDEGRRLNGNTNGKPSDDMNKKILKMLLELIAMLLGLQGQAKPQGGCGVDGCQDHQACKAASPIQGPSGADALDNNGTEPISTGNGKPSSDLAKFEGVNDPQLQEYLNQLAEDPEGQNLLTEAQRRGVSIEVGQPADGALAHFDPASNKIVIGKDTMKNGTGLQSLIHELVHATTPQDGDSQHEEGMANVIADRIAARINGRQPRDGNGIYSSTLGLYGELGRYNAGFDENISNVLNGRIRAAA
jgi:hypothetical protein